MFRFLILIPWIVVATGAGPQGASVNDVIRGNNQFALDLYGKARARSGNVFFSPYSVSTALALTYSGANGETASEMAATLHFPTDRAALEAGFAGLIDQTLGGDPKKPYQLDTANALWGQSGLDYRADFLERSSSLYKATLHPLDFLANPDAARRTINDWVEQRTHEKIKNLLAPGTIQRETDLILTNAIYFKAAWMKPFAKSATTDQDFLGSTGKVTVPLMNKLGQFSYLDVESDHLQILDLPYSGGAISMSILLPKAMDGLGPLESTLTARKLEDWLSRLEASRQVNLTLPRFQMEQSFELGTTLKELGMSRAFGPQADFSGITTSRHLHLSNVIHKAFIDVNEEGSEAAAATAIIMGRTAVMVPQKPVVNFRADHPFLFLIRDHRSGSILFIGRVTDSGK